MNCVVAVRCSPPRAHFRAGREARAQSRPGIERGVRSNAPVRDAVPAADPMLHFYRMHEPVSPAPVTRRGSTIFTAAAAALGRRLGFVLAATLVFATARGAAVAQNRLADSARHVDVAVDAPVLLGLAERGDAKAAWLRARGLPSELEALVAGEDDKAGGRR